VTLLKNSKIEFDVKYVFA